MTEQERLDSYAHRDERREEVYSAVIGAKKWVAGAMLTLILWAVGSTYHYAQTVTRVSALETEASLKRTRIENIGNRLANAETIAAGVGARMEAQSRTLDRIETRLERLIERLDNTARP